MKTRKIWNFINNEKGSGMLILIVGMLMAAIFFSLVFFDFSSVFINKRVTQTGADSAALAAAKSSTIFMKKTLQEETQEELDALGDAWEAFKEAAAGDAEGDDESGEKSEPKSEAELLSEFVEAMEANYEGRSMPGDIISWLLDHSVEVEARTAMEFFFAEKGVRKIACKAVRDNEADAKAEADKFAEENQNDKVSTLNFIPAEFRYYAVTERKGEYTTVPDEGVPAISAESSARIGEPDGFNIVCD
ncbi:pilus assembly protein TadG-related protein [Bacillus infantis]|uniref:pilus assembly protein TadG-related protein n=1 Tax=Bacillus infantis TaxID=324767 RepID=UPI003CF8395D